jgi:hypothetical protein
MDPLRREPRGIEGSSSLKKTRSRIEIGVHRVSKQIVWNDEWRGEGLDSPANRLKVKTESLFDTSVQLKQKDELIVPTSSDHIFL